MAAVGAGEGAGMDIDDRLSTLFAQLTRDPDFDAEELQAYDAADQLILRTAAEELAANPLAPPLAAGQIVIIGDRHGALTLGAAATLIADTDTDIDADADAGADADTDTGADTAPLATPSKLRVHQDPLLGERALAQNAERLGLAGRFTNHGLGAELLRGARVVLVQLPRGLSQLAEISEAIAQWADPDVIVFAGGRVKHMTRSMNDVLARDFENVSAGLGWRKSRVLRADSPRTAARPSDGAAPASAFPKWGTDRDLDFSLASFGATFGGPVLDHGSRLLLSTLAGSDRSPQRIVDLGCGNGVLAVAAAKRFPESRVIATDHSIAAVAATKLTAQAAGVADRIDVYRADALEAVPAEWADLILLNPPFHTGATVHAGVGQRLIRACRPALAPGGELRLVFNSHLNYGPLIEREIGPVRQLARTSTFTVLSATRRAQ